MSVTENASELEFRMRVAIHQSGYTRKSGDSISPMQGETLEALGQSFQCLNLDLNLVNRRMDLRWATANVLQFFADTENAGPLLKCNKRAKEFLTGDKWIGAYGRIAMPQLRACLAILQNSLQSRRAIVSMGETLPADINRPACISFMHFLTYDRGLFASVYQRSLNVANVMPYDYVLLTHIVMYIAKHLGIAPYKLLWTVGSLHLPLPLAEVDRSNLGYSSLMVPLEVMTYPELAWAKLCNLADGSEEYKQWIK